MQNLVQRLRTLAAAVLLATSACFIYLFTPSYKQTLFAEIFRPVCITALAAASVLLAMSLLDALFFGGTARKSAFLRAACSLVVVLIAAKNAAWMINGTSSSLVAGGWTEAWPHWTILMPIFTVASVGFKPQGRAR